MTERTPLLNLQISANIGVRVPYKRGSRRDTIGIKIGVAQFESTRDPESNLSAILDFIDEAR